MNFSTPTNLKRKLQRLAGALWTVCALNLAGTSHAAPVLNPANGHIYDAISAPGGITWDDAKAAAEAMGGHLATISSVDENTFIFVNLPEASLDGFGYWLGAFQPGDTPEHDADPAAGWHWVTGESFDYSFWAHFGGPFGEPNDTCWCGYTERGHKLRF